MNLTYQAGQLCLDKVPLATVAADYGTPLYVYSADTIQKNWQRFDAEFTRSNHLICYAVKANANPAILSLLNNLGSGFDIVSAGEMQMVLAAGAAADKIVFSGVGKSREEIAYALENRVGCFNVESVPELERINEIAGKLGVQATIAIRANPDVDAGTHPYIATGLEQNKFGIPVQEVVAVAELARGLDHVRLTGLACHIGSQIESVDPFIAAAKSLESVRVELTQRGFVIETMDLGGGLAATDAAPSASDWINALEANVSPDVRLKIEPGRSIVANAGVLLTRVEYLKRTQARNFLIVDAGMNDFLRPALYQGWHDIKSCREPDLRETETWDIVGPVCESADFLGHERQLAVAEDDILAIIGTGAYGYVMSFTYNGRQRPAEIMIEQGRPRLVRERQGDLLGAPA